METTPKNILTSWSTILHENLTGSQLVKKFTEFYGTRKFMTAFASARHMSLSTLKIYINKTLVDPLN